MFSPRAKCLSIEGVVAAEEESAEWGKWAKSVGLDWPSAKWRDCCSFSSLEAQLRLLYYMVRFPFSYSNMACYRDVVLWFKVVLSVFFYKTLD
jgi:hypothetical protein